MGIFKSITFHFMQKVKRNSLLLLFQIIPKKFIFSQLIRIPHKKLTKAFITCCKSESYDTARFVFSVTPPQQNKVITINFSPNGDNLSILCAGRLLFIYDFSYIFKKTFGQIILKINLEEDNATCCTFSPSSSHIAVGFKNKKVIVYGVNRLNKDKFGQIILKLQWDKGAAISISYTPSGDYLAVVRKELSVIIFGMDHFNQTSYSKIVTEFYKNNEYPIYCLSYSPTFNSIALGSLGKTIIISYYDIIYDDYFNNDIEQKILEDKGSKEITNILAYSPSGDYLVTGSMGNKVIIYGANYFNKAYYGSELVVLDGFKGYVDSISFSFSGYYVAFGIHDTNEDIIYSLKPNKKHFGKQIIKLNAFKKSEKRSLSFSTTRPFLASVCNIKSVVIYY